MKKLRDTPTFTDVDFTEGHHAANVEENRAKLAELEVEWAQTGPLRKITFTAHTFSDMDRAKSFLKHLIDNGIEDAQWDAGDLVWITVEMEPSAENVTRWEYWFERQVSTMQNDAYGGPIYDRWRYPKKLSPCFYYGISTDRRELDHKVEERAQVLFGKSLGVDTVKKMSWVPNGVDLSPPFKLVPSEFIETARLNRPKSPEATASNFAQWLYSLYSNRMCDVLDKERGKQAEKDILFHRQRTFASLNNRWLEKCDSEWRLTHSGLNLDRAPSPFYVPDLLVGNEQLRCVPDLIYKNRITEEMIIVEIKHTYMDIPNNLWPNIWGQLWCYAQLPLVRKAPKVTVVGEIWGDCWYGYGTSRALRLRATVRRNPRDVAYDRFFRRLFEIYSGAQ